MARPKPPVAMIQRSIYFNSDALAEVNSRLRNDGISLNKFMNGLMVEWLEGEWEKDRVAAEREKNLGSGW